MQREELRLQKKDLARIFVNEGFNKYYLEAVNRIEAAKAEKDLAEQHIDALNLRIESLSQRLINVETNIRFLKKEWMVASMYAYALAKKERQQLKDQIRSLKNERIRLRFLADNLSVQIVHIQSKLPSLQSKVIRLRDE